MSTKDEALKLALEALEGMTIKGRVPPTGIVFSKAKAALAACEQALAAPVQEPVATVIEELEHDGEGFCAKVRWLYNPVPVGETLSWEQPK